MKNRVWAISIALLWPFYSLAWGFFAHSLINTSAVYALPPAMYSFYHAHISYIRQHAIDPDKRRYSDTAEACRHYIDLDEYEKISPFDSISFQYHADSIRFGYAFMVKQGLVPWYIQWMYQRLERAFEQHQAEAVLHISSDIGHYIADAHVPLHTSSNYNGQKTGQEGIHALWESAIPELLMANWLPAVKPASYISSSKNWLRNILFASHQCLDSVFRFESNINQKFSERAKFQWNVRSGSLVKSYADSYIQQYHAALGNQVERRLYAAVQSVSNCWYSAWVDAGMPEMSQWKSSDKQENQAHTPPTRLFQDRELGP